jgi:hypothetical protein
MRDAAVITLALAALAPGFGASAQPDVTWLCRVHFEEQTFGGDTLATRGVIEIDRAAPQMDGSAYYMGRGQAQIIFTPGGANCRATSGGQASASLLGIVSSDDGQTATVDITPMSEDSFPVVVQCGPQRSEMEVGVSVPPSVTMPLRDGASATYSETHRSTFATGRAQGIVRLEFCSPTPPTQP